MQKKIVVAGVCVLLSGCAIQTTRVDNLYTQRLVSRSQQYTQDADQLDNTMRQQVVAYATPVREANTTNNRVSISVINEEVFRSAELHARAGIVDRFMKEAAVSGQVGLMDSWLRNQANEVISLSARTGTAVAELQKAAATNANDPQLGAQFYDVLSARGAEQGAAEEILALNNDLQGYSKDYAAAAAAQAHPTSLYALLTGISAGEDTAYAQAQSEPAGVPQMPMIPMKQMLTTTCTHMGMFTTCNTF